MRNKIRELIEKLGVTAYRFSEDTGISKTTVYALQKNRNQCPSPDVMDKIIRVYPSVTPNDLVEWCSDENEDLESAYREASQEPDDERDATLADGLEDG